MKGLEEQIDACIKEIRDCMTKKLNLRNRDSADSTFSLNCILEAYRSVHPYSYQLEWEYIHPIAVSNYHRYIEPED